LYVLFEQLTIFIYLLNRCQALQLQPLLGEKIISIAREEDITSKKKLILFSGYCHNHIRNLWFKALSTRMRKQLEEEFQDDLENIPYILRVTFDLMNIHHCIDKECNETAKYMPRVMGMNVKSGLSVITLDF